MALFAPRALSDTPDTPLHRSGSRDAREIQTELTWAALVGRAYCGAVGKSKGTACWRAAARGAVAGARARSAAATRVTDIGARRATAATAASMNVRAGKLMTDLTDCSNVHRTAWGIRHLVACFHGVPSDQPSSCSRRIAPSSLFSRKTIT